jgi:chromosome segregation ATPase
MGESPMARVITHVSRVAIFLAGAATVALTASARRGRRQSAMETVQDLKRSLASLDAKLDAKLEARESAGAARFSHIESRLDLHEAKLADVPSTSQIVAAMEQLLSKTMSSLDDRLTTQAHSIEVLRTTVSQTDGLLERVLESLDSMQSMGDAEFAEDPLQSRPVG